jgi:COP9 signalosome complex subunit 7
MGYKKMEDALEQYLILAKNAKGKAQESIVEQVVANPNTFVFGELIPHLTDISEPYKEMMRVFAYGTMADYEAKKADLPEFKPSMIHKLQILTLASLAANSRFLPYTTLISELKVNSVREVEDLIIHAIYSGLIEGRIDHKLSALHV